MRHYIITGRRMYDDEDSAEVITAATEEEAEAIFRDNRMEGDPITEEDCVVFNAVFDCGPADQPAPTCLWHI